MLISCLGERALPFKEHTELIEVTHVERTKYAPITGGDLPKLTRVRDAARA